MKKWFIIFMLFIALSFAQSGDQPYIITALNEWKSILINVGTTLAAILVIIGAIVYGISQMQPAEVRGKWESTAVGLVIGGIVIAAIIGVSGLIIDFSGDMFKSTSDVQANQGTSPAPTPPQTPFIANPVPDAQ
ncbi:hypothetical protein KO465_02880 [Candidatus Micrarchaeota archaeon]|nr:hypothetical protein [Candidatus Micrarchaeota archaeon]